MRATRFLVIAALFGLFAPTAWSQGGPDVGLEARIAFAPSLLAADASVAPNVATLTVNVSSEDDASLNLLVTHEDAGETIVDRVIPMDVTAGATAHVTVQGLRPEAGFAVRALPATTPLPRVSDATDLVLGNDTRNLVDLGNTTVPPPVIPDLSQHAARAYLAARADPGTHIEGRQLVALPSGLVLLLYVQEEGEADTADRGNYTLYARLSRDGGRSFGERATVAAASNVSLMQFQAAGFADGTISVLWNWYISASPPLRGYELVRLDASTLTILAKTPVAGREGFYPDRVAVALPNGTLLLPIGDAAGLAMWHLSREGVATLGGVLRVEGWPGAPQGVLGVVSAEGVVAFAFSVSGDGTARPWMTRSLDGGKTFSTPVLLHEPGGYVEGPTGLAVDDAGTAHVSLYGWKPIDGSTDSRALYARVDRLGNVTTRSLNELAGYPADARLFPPIVGALGHHVWLFWYEQGADRSTWGTHAVESLTQGLTFGPSHHFVLHYENETFTNMYAPEQALVTFDGRPLLLNALDSTHVLATVPLFDPLADVASGLLRIEGAAAREGFLRGPPSVVQISSPTDPSGTETGSSAEPVPIPWWAPVAAATLATLLPVRRRRR